LGKPGRGVYFCAIQLGMPSHVGLGPGREFARRTRKHDTGTRPVAGWCPLQAAANLGFQKRYATAFYFTCNSVQSIYNSVIKFKPHPKKLVTMNINYIPDLKLNS